jgi:hypothetical protein
VYSLLFFNTFSSILWTVNSPVYTIALYRIVSSVKVQYKTVNTPNFVSLRMQTLHSAFGCVHHDPYPACACIACAPPAPLLTVAWRGRQWSHPVLCFRCIIVGLTHPMTVWPGASETHHRSSATLRLVRCWMGDHRTVWRVGNTGAREHTKVEQHCARSGVGWVTVRHFTITVRGRCWRDLRLYNSFTRLAYQPLASMD